MKNKIIEFIIKFLTKNNKISIKTCQNCNGSGIELEPTHKQIIIMTEKQPIIDEEPPIKAKETEEIKEKTQKRKRNTFLKTLSAAEKKKIYMKEYNARPEIRQKSKERNHQRYLKEKAIRDQIKQQTQQQETKQETNIKTPYWLRPEIIAKRKEYHKIWREKNKEKLKEYTRKKTLKRIEEKAKYELSINNN